MTFTMAEFVSILGLVVTIVGLFSTMIWKLYTQIRANKTDLDAFKLEVATHYVSSSNMSSIKEDLIRSEERTLSAIQGLTARFDKFLTRHNGD